MYETIPDKIYHLFPWLRDLFTDWLGGFWPSWAVTLIDAFIGIIFIIAVAFVFIIILVIFERRGIGQFQVRPGPNRAGPFGVLQPIADAIKLFTKEDVVPAQSDKLVHLLAPVVAFVPFILVLAVIPIDRNAIFADLNVGILYIVAVGTLGVVAVFMAGWASNNKYSLLGAMRVMAQMVSYELPVVLSIVGVIMVVQSLQMSEIVGAQTIPYILIMPLGFLIYFMATAAELNRSPMDLVEAESEIVAGYQTEYSGMKFALFYLGEFGHLFAVSCIVTTLFLSGWKGPVLPPYVWFVIKAVAVYFVFLWMRATLPRVRIDQVMGFAWKFLFPLALINIFVIGIEVVIWSEWLASWQQFPWPFLFVNMALAGGAILVWSKLFFKLGGGRVEVREIWAGDRQGTVADL